MPAFTFRRSGLVRALALTGLLAVSVVACDDDNSITNLPADPPIPELAEGTPQLSTLLAAIQAAGLAEALAGNGPFTVFAPVNNAFAKLPAEELNRLLQDENKDELRSILQLHVVRGEYRASSLSNGQMLTTLEGTAIGVSIDQGIVTVGGAVVSATDIDASNGVVHLIESVILPEQATIAELAAGTPELSTLVAALSAAGLVDTFDGEGSFTVFAPLNSAFDGLPAGTVQSLLAAGNEEILDDLLKYHVVTGAAVTSDQLTDGQQVATLEGGQLTIGVSDSGVTVNGASVKTANIRAGNGVIHLIDGVLTETLDAVQRASVTPDVATLVTAVAAGELAETLKGDGPFTIFAPVNDAFGSFTEGQLTALLDPANKALLQKVLTYHVVLDDIREADLTDGATVPTIQGTEVTIDLSDGAKVNGANIIATDIVVSNGVIHLIDGVLTENLDIVDQAILNGFSSLVGAVSAANLVETLRTDNLGAGFTVFAPTDAAFAALGSVPSDPAVLADILLYHVLDGTVLSADLSDGQVATTLQGGALTVGIDGNEVAIQGAQNAVQVIVKDVPATNGVIHVIDAVLLPPTN